MDRSIVQIRLMIASLIFGLAFALGVSSVSAGAPPCSGQSGTYQLADQIALDTVHGVDQACGEQECGDDPRSGCSAILGHSCSSGALAALTTTPFATREFARSLWAFATTNVLAGLDPQVGHGPPRPSI